MRPPALRLHADELIVDNFAGGGGASLGIEWALGRSPDIAINHDAEAIAMHRANHPGTRHYCESVWDVDPIKACGGRRVALAWFSPDCTFHSKARGGKPFRDRNKARRRRGLAWIVVRWAKAVRPRVIILENVEEFEDWGPLLDDGTPCPLRRGFTFRRWKGMLENVGYTVEHRELRACDYGAPTTRKRLFVIARCDGNPIVWPEPTHGPRHSLAYRTAAECIDWSRPCPSIFERKPALVDNTLRRIARGVMRYVVNDLEPFIVGAGGPAYAGKPRPIGQPFGAVMPANHACLVAAFLARHYGGHENDGAPVQLPIPTITATDHHALVASHLVKFTGGFKDHRNTAQAATEPLHTIRAQGNHFAEVRAFLFAYYGTAQDQRPDRPLATVVTRDRFGLVTVHGDDYAIGDIGMRMLIARELYRAQGFGDDYVIDPVVRRMLRGKIRELPLTQKAQVRMAGNSVCPPLAAALARPQFEATRRYQAVA